VGGLLSEAARRHHRRFLTEGMAAVIVIALVKLALHWIFNNRYGYFRDEFDYIACGDHPAWGYVDQPPLVPIVLKLTRLLLGDSLRVIRLPGALAISAAVVLAGMIARELGGRRFALILTALTMLVVPMYLSDGSLMTTNSFEPLLWMGCAYFAILAIERADPRYWLWFGVVAGIGLEEKYSIAVLGAGIVVGLLTEHRRFLLNKWLWLGGAAAFLIVLPNLIWNVQNQFPFAQLMHNIKVTNKDVVLTPLQYFVQQILLIGPVPTLIWLTGLAALFFWRPLRPYRLFGWCYLVAFAVMSRGKNYYLAPIYPVLIAAGAVAMESALARTRQQIWLKPAIAVVLVSSGAWLAPIIMPVLPIDQFIVYMDHLPFKIPRSEHSHTAALPQHFADQFGWQDLTAAVAKVWDRIPPDQRGDCAIFGTDYGEAGAIDFLGPRYGLPKAISGHQTYYLWGPRQYSGNCMIVLNQRRESLERRFDHVEYMGTSENPYAEEQHAIFLCTGKKFSSLAAIWPQVKMYR
jgi:4-amino-4-deoxy-L-arabinose transferase-like glycosyltransferase